jgi:DNA mismatch repair protein MutS2
MGSKLGSIIYIEPEATLQYSELSNLEYEESEEIMRILNSHQMIFAIFALV